MPGKLAVRIAAIAAALSGVTTILLWGLPYLVPEGAGPAQLPQEPAYMGRLWVNFFHVLVALFAYGMVARLLARRSVTLAAVGFGAFAFWSFTEALGVAVNIFAVNGAWRPALLAGGEAARTAAVGLAWFPAWWDAAFFLLLVAFLVGTTALGAAAAAGRGLERLMGGLLLAAAPLTLLIMASEYFGFAGASAVEVVYPALQPASRVLMGVWLWREARALAA